MRLYVVFLLLFSFLVACTPDTTTITIVGSLDIERIVDPLDLIPRNELVNESAVPVEKPPVDRPAEEPLQLLNQMVYCSWENNSFAATTKSSRLVLGDEMTVTNSDGVYVSIDAFGCDWLFYDVPVLQSDSLAIVQEHVETVFPEADCAQVTVVRSLFEPEDFSCTIEELVEYSQ